MRQIADKRPLALANHAIREPWLGLGTSTGALLATAAIAVIAVIAVIARCWPTDGRRSESAHRRRAEPRPTTRLGSASLAASWVTPGDR